MRYSAKVCDRFLFFSLFMLICAWSRVLAVTVLALLIDVETYLLFSFVSTWKQLTPRKIVAMAEAWFCQKQGVKTECCWWPSVDVERVVAFYLFLPVEWFLGYRLALEKKKNCNMNHDDCFICGGRNTLDKSILCWNGKQNWVHLYTSPEWLLLVMLWPCSGIFRIWLLPWFIWNGSVVLLVDTFEQISHLTSVLPPILIIIFKKGRGHCSLPVSYTHLRAHETRE